MHSFIYDVGLAVIGLPVLFIGLFIGGVILKALGLGCERSNNLGEY